MRMPPQNNRCNAGPCEIGALFTDALKWQTGADIAFIISGGLRGGDWAEGRLLAAACVRIGG